MTGYMFVKYVADSDSLGIALMNSDAVETAIENGSLKGKLGDTLSSSVRITEGQEGLQKFLLCEDEDLFPEMKYMVKLELPKQHAEQRP